MIVVPEGSALMRTFAMWLIVLVGARRFELLPPAPSSLLNHHDTLFQVRAREVSSAVCFEGSQLFAACSADPSFGLELYSRLLDLVAGRVKATESRLAEFCGSAITPSELAHQSPSRR